MLILYVKKEDAYSTYDDINGSDFVNYYEDGGNNDKMYILLHQCPCPSIISFATCCVNLK